MTTAFSPSRPRSAGICLFHQIFSSSLGAVAIRFAAQECFGCSDFQLLEQFAARQEFRSRLFHGWMKTQCAHCSSSVPGGSRKRWVECVVHSAQECCVDEEEEDSEKDGTVNRLLGALLIFHRESTIFVANFPRRFAQCRFRVTGSKIARPFPAQIAGLCID